MFQFDIAYAYGWRGENKDPQTGELANGSDDDDQTFLFTMRRFVGAGFVAIRRRDALTLFGWSGTRSCSTSFTPGQRASR